MEHATDSSHSPPTQPDAGGATTCDANLTEKVARLIAQLLEHHDNGKRGECELEARIKTPFQRQAGVDVFDFRYAQKMLDSYPDWLMVEDTSCRDVVGRLPGSNPRIGRFHQKHVPGSKPVHMIKTKLDQVESVLERDIVDGPPPHQTTADGKQSAAAVDQRYRVRFALSKEEQLNAAEVAPVMDASCIQIVRYKKRKSYVFPPFRYELTLVWSGKTPTEAEQALEGVIPTSAEVEIEFNPTLAEFRNSLQTPEGEDDTMTMAALFISRVAHILGKDASLVGA